MTFSNPSPLAYRRYLNALAQRLRRGESPENWSRTRQAIRDHLRAYLAGAVHRVDPEIAAALIVAIEQAEAKVIPQLFTPMAHLRGERGESAELHACRAAAGTYIQFCHDHKGHPAIDGACVKTVANAFGVNRSTASRWKRLRSAVSHPDGPAGRIETDRDRVVEFDSTEVLFKDLAARMRASARQYVRFGGAGAKAIADRNRKRVGQ